MTAPLFIVEWDPTTDTAHVRATFDTVTGDEATAGLDQWIACVDRCREINAITGVSGREVDVTAVSDTGPVTLPVGEDHRCSLCNDTGTAGGCPECGMTPEDAFRS